MSGKEVEMEHGNRTLQSVHSVCFISKLATYQHIPCKVLTFGINLN